MASESSRRTKRDGNDEAAVASRMALTAGGLAETAHALATAVPEFLAPAQRPANVIGLASGVKWVNGEPTGEQAVLVLVRQKVPLDLLDPTDVVPKQLAGVQTDVLNVGEVFAGGEAPAVDAQTLTKRVRPAAGGYSVGHFAITAGTIATGVYDVLPGGSANPPAHGIGMPPRYYILSNNHVLANSNDARLGDAILQPGPADGGTNPADRIARLTRFIPITFAPATPLERHRNLVDAAIAEGDFHDLDRESYWSGHVRGWRRRSGVNVGTVVKKTGRTTSFTTGRITAVNATIDVNYGLGRTARFTDQILTTNMSAPGDSGSLVTTLDNVAVGLLFAGSSVQTILNQIEHVRSLLRVEVAEQLA